MKILEALRVDLTPMFRLQIKIINTASCCRQDCQNRLSWNTIYTEYTVLKTYPLNEVTVSLLPNHNWKWFVCNSTSYCVCLVVCSSGYLFIQKLNFFQCLNGASCHHVRDVTLTSLSSVLIRVYIGSLACFALWRTFSQPFTRYQGFRYNSSA